MSAAANSTPAVQPSFRGGVIAYLQVDGASRASEFYQRAFGAQELFRHTPDEKGRTMHLHLQINGSSLILCDPYPEQGHPHHGPQGYHLFMPVDDIDAWFERAVAAGCSVVMPVEKMFWGDRYAQLRDPFGVLWAMDEPAR